MEREQAQKLLAALIFDDLDEASKTELLAYLETDDDLRQQLLDLRMATKLTSEAVQQTPEPTLSEQRLQQLSALSNKKKPRTRFILLKWASGIAAILLMCLFFLPSLHKVQHQTKSSVRRSQERQEEMLASMAAEPDYESHEWNDQIQAPKGEVASINRPQSALGQSLHLNPRVRTRQVASDAQPQSVLLEEFSLGYHGDTSGAAQASEPIASATPPSTRFGVDGRETSSVDRLNSDQYAYLPSSKQTASLRIDEARGPSPRPDGQIVDTLETANQDIGPKKMLDQPASHPPTHQPTDVMERQERLAGAYYRDNNSDGMHQKGDVTHGRSVTGKDQGSVVVANNQRVSILGDLPLESSLFRETHGDNRAGGTSWAYDVDGDSAPTNKPQSINESAPKPASETGGRSLLAKDKKNAEKVNDLEKGEAIQLGEEWYEQLTEQPAGHVTKRRSQDKTPDVTPPDKAKPESTELEGLAKAKKPVVIEKLITNALSKETDMAPGARFDTVPVNPWVLSATDALSTFGLDVDTASYTICRRYIQNGMLPPVGAVRMEEFVNYFDYDYPPQNQRTFAVFAQATSQPFGDPGKARTLLKVAVKARTLGRDQQRPAHLVLVVDASASMGQPDRLPLVQQALHMLVDRLSPQDRVTLISCAQEARLHLEAVPAGDPQIIHQAIDAIQPAGSTHLLAGMQVGYAAARRYFDAQQLNHVILCSDGVANVGQTEAAPVLAAVAEDRKQGISLTTVGVGYGVYNDTLLEDLANQGDGQYVYLDRIEQAERVFVTQFAATLHNVAQEARIQVHFNPERVRRYRLIGYENRALADERFRDDTVDAAEIGSGQCATALFELELIGMPSVDPAGDLGTVSVRYRATGTPGFNEISQRLGSALVQDLRVEAHPRFYLAAGASWFAEWLRNSEHVRSEDYQEVLETLEQVQQTLPLDRDIEELVALMRAAQHLPRAP